MIDRLLKRAEFAGVHGVISSKGNGAAGLMNGEADSALQFESEILPHKEIEPVGALPEELGAFVNIDVAVVAKATAGGRTRKPSCAMSSAPRRRRCGRPADLTPKN